MSLTFNRKDLERIVREEFTRYLSVELVSEAPPGRGTVLDDEPPSPEDAPEEQMPKSSPAPEVGDEPGEPDELETGEEPADADLEKDLAGEEGEEGTVAGEIANKTVESISMEEDSKIMPGASEVVVTFKESPDALRLLITKSGRVKIFYKGLHNDFGSPVEQIPGEEPEMDLGAEEMPGEEPAPEEMEDMPPLGPEDMPGEEEKLGDEEV
jgi:hypothetical protein